MATPVAGRKLDLDDVAPGEPERRQPPGGAGVIDLTGKSAVVTGGSRGIGRAIVAAPGRRRARTSRSATAATRPRPRRRRRGRGARPARPSPSRATSRDPASAEALVAAALAAFGKIDILVNNAGITRDDLIMRMSLDAWRDVLETNLFGAFYAIKAVTRPMLKAQGGPDHQHHEHLGTGRPGGPGQLHAAKAGLIGLTKATARELGSRGITANAVAPGFVLTELTQDLPEALPGRDHRADPARPLRHDRRRRQRRSPSSPRTRRHTSPARCSPSTAAS